MSTRRTVLLLDWCVLKKRRRSSRRIGNSIWEQGAKRLMGMTLSRTQSQRSAVLEDVMRESSWVEQG